MNDDFEQRLHRQPLRQIPSQWRSEILQNVVTAPHSSSVIRHSNLSTLNHRLSTLLWPHPKAWAGLTALWVAIAVVQVTVADRPVHVAKKAQPPSADTIIVLQQQTRMLAELVGHTPPPDADRPKPGAPQPRSERRTETSFA